VGRVQHAPYGEIITSTLPVTPVLTGAEGLTISPLHRTALGWCNRAGRL
jgi:hypothetical protein